MQQNYVTFCLTGDVSELSDFRRNLLLCEQSQTDEDMCTSQNLTFLNIPTDYDFFWWKGNQYEIKTASNGQNYLEWQIVSHLYADSDLCKLIETQYSTIHVCYQNSYLETNDEEGIFFRRFININGLNYLLSSLEDSEKWAVLHIDDNIQGETLTVDSFVEYLGKKYPITQLANVFLGDEVLESQSSYPPRLKEIILPKGVQIVEDSFENFDSIKITEI